MKRIGVGGLLHETNTFSNTPTPLENFINQSGFYPRLLQGEDILELSEGRFNIAMSGFLADTSRYDLSPVPLIWAGAEPSRPLKEEDFDHLLDMMITALKENGPYEGIFLDLHGAMVYGHLQDGEEEILSRVRDVVGDIPIVVSLDLHGNISPRSFELATVMIGYRTYPHVDGFETGQRCAKALRHVLSGSQVHGFFRQSPFLMPATTQPTTKEPAQSLYTLLDELDKKPGLISATIMEGFNACDLPHTGPSVFAYAESKRMAQETVDFLMDEILAREAQFSVEMYEPAEAIRRAKDLAAGTDKPIILVDVQDNAGGGSPSDTIWLLEAAVEEGLENCAIGVIWDPKAAELAHRSGEGTTVRIPLGGHTLPGQTPFDAEYEVIRLHDGDFPGTGPMVAGRTLNLGKMVQLRLGSIRIVVSSDRMQALDQSLFKVVGVDPAEMKYLILKSANHYRADFGLISGGIINVDAPSAIIEDPSKIRYAQLREGVRLKGNGPVFKKPM